MSFLNEDLQPLLNKAFFYLKFRPRTKKETENYLFKKVKTTHWSTDVVKKIITYLEEIELIDDKKFTAWFVEQRNLLKPKSQFLLTKELLQHGVDKNLIDDYFSNNSLNEEELAFKTLKSRWNRYKNFDKRKQFEKVVSFLMRRGFSYEISKQTVKKLEEI
jgi:regulatory protein